MSKAEIIEELPKLPPEDRAEIQAKLDELVGEAWLDGDDPLTDEEKVLLEARLNAYERNPDGGSSWEDVAARLRVRLQR